MVNEWPESWIEEGRQAVLARSIPCPKGKGIELDNISKLRDLCLDGRSLNLETACEQVSSLNPKAADALERHCFYKETSGSKDFRGVW